MLPSCKTHPHFQFQRPVAHQIAKLKRRLYLNCEFSQSSFKKLSSSIHELSYYTATSLLPVLITCLQSHIGLGGSKYISFEERQWHNDCFNCKKCSVSLVGRGFLTERDDILVPSVAKTCESVQETIQACMTHTMLKPTHWQSMKPCEQWIHLDTSMKT